MAEFGEWTRWKRHPPRDWKKNLILGVGGALQNGAKVREATNPENVKENIFLRRFGGIKQGGKSSHNYIKTRVCWATRITWAHDTGALFWIWKGPYIVACWLCFRPVTNSAVNNCLVITQQMGFRRFADFQKPMLPLWNPWTARPELIHKYNTLREDSKVDFFRWLIINLVSYCSSTQRSLGKPNANPSHRDVAPLHAC